MSDLIIEYVETICQNLKGYALNDNDYQNHLFTLIQDSLLTNGKVTITAGSAVSGIETTYTLTADSELKVSM